MGPGGRMHASCGAGGGREAWRCRASGNKGLLVGTRHPRVARSTFDCGITKATAFLPSAAGTGVLFGSRADTATAVGTTDPRRPSNEVPDLRGLPPPSEAAAFPRPQNSMVRRANETPDDASAGMRCGKAVQCDDGRDLAAAK